MAMFRKAATILSRTVSSRMNLETSVSKPSILQAIRCMSTSKVFIGGLSYNTDEQALRETFDKYGQVVDARVIIDRDSGRSRGFGFVTFTSPEEASSAIQAMDQKELDGRILKVNYANERPPRNFGDGGGGGYGGGGYGGGGYGGGAGGYGGGGYNGGGGGYGGGGYSGGGGGYSGGGGGYNAGGGGGYGGGGYNAGASGAYGAGGETQTGGGGFSYGGGSYGSNTAVGGGFENKFDGGADEGSYTPENYADKQA